MQALGTRHATCYYQYTLTRHTFVNPAVKVKQLVISTSQIAMTKTSTMVPFSPCLPSSNTSCRLPPRLNLPRSATPLQTTLEELVHVQPTPTPVTTKNITAQGLTIGTMTSKASKLMDQRFHWLKFRHAQRQFQYLWQKGILNCADYSSKHHAPKHHQNVCTFVVFDNTTFPKQWVHLSPWCKCLHIFGLSSVNTMVHFS